jgi:excinuclease ABC subunit B
MYADRTTAAMSVAIETTQARRRLQENYNLTHGITPEGIKKAMGERMRAAQEAEKADIKEIRPEDIPADERKRLIAELTQQMHMAAENLQFEKAAALRDQIDELSDATKKPRRVVRGR